MKRLLVLMAAPLLFAAGCSSSTGGTPTAAPTTAATSTAPATEGTGPATEGTGPAATPTTAATSGATTGTKTGGGGAPTKQASTTRCHTADLKVSLGESDGAAGTIYFPLIFKNTSNHTCTLYGYPGVSWVAGSDGHQVNVAFVRDSSAKATITLAAGGVAHSMLATHDVGFFDAPKCKPVSVRGLRVYPPDETASVFVALPTKACSVNGVNTSTVSPVAKGATL